MATVRSYWRRYAGLFSLGAAALAVLVSSPAAAQFSDSYNFLKAVRDRDGAKATDLLGSGGSSIIDTRDKSTGESALHIATKRRDTAWMGFLLGKGARVDIKDNDGNTPLMITAQLGFPEGADLLIGRRAAVDATNGSGETALIMAAQRRDNALVRLLLTAGANPDKADTIAGMSARDYAKRDGRSEAILKLMDEIKAKPRPKAAGPSL
ncbi:MAG: hypothetical protein ABS87_02800 [Sphingomonas sp. SCN 67-18]|uniref:ankyrin repeat domain-containing protein n=1 Tax=uncultured Sphingomonas sp. TaxID=158754 RepID=UPI00086E2AC2|nr:ankyrin repeat domain-containing protein [Sphingomonas sp. SCN 67-18]ODU22294.1 MAG: hypothetical protein ABS87_02800 [Sphingomonas sp. SCN 67-18]